VADVFCLAMIDRGEQEEDDVTLEKGAEEAVAQRIPKLPVGPKRCLIALLCRWRVEGSSCSICPASKLMPTPESVHLRNVSLNI
jgi:hypothetical protein